MKTNDVCLIFQNTSHNFLPSLMYLFTVLRRYASEKEIQKDIWSQREDDERNDGECINPADVEHGSLIDINGTLFVVEIRPVFHTNRGAWSRKLSELASSERNYTRKKWLWRGGDMRERGLMVHGQIAPSKPRCGDCVA